MAVINDIGNVKDIHPANKQEVGHRLALLALAKTYGQSDVLFSGPVFKAMAIEDGCAAHFRDTSLAEVVTSRPEARAYQVERASEGGDAIETPLTARLLS